MTTSRSPSRRWAPSHRARAVAGLLGVVVLGVVTVSLLRQADLLALPAVGLVVATWTALGALSLAGRAWRELIRVWPRLRVLAGEAWAAIGDEPELRRATSAGSTVSARVHGAWQRLRPRRDLDLARISAGSVVVAAVAGLIAVWLLVRVEPPELDRRFVDLATQLQVELARRTMLGLTGLGDNATVVGLLVAGAGVAVWLRDRLGGVLLLGPPLVAATVTRLLKMSVARQRPALGQLAESSHSWPSGHATIGLAMALGITLLAARRGWRWRRVAAVMIPLGLAIGYSRAYLTVHWLSDVAAGWLVAIAATAAVVAVVGRPRAATPPPARGTGGAGAGTPKPARRAGSLALTGTVTAGLLVVAVASSGRILTQPPVPAPRTVTSVQPLLVELGANPFSRTLLGRTMEPISLVVVADTATFQAAINSAGWTVADRPTISRLMTTYDAGLRRRDDASAPVTPTFYGVAMQDLAIQQSAGSDGVRSRHHARFWDQRAVLPGGCSVWFGTASLDDRIEWNWHTVVPEHHIAPAIDVEREHVADTLTATGLLRRQADLGLVGPTLGTNAASDPFFTDGRAVVLQQAGGCAAG